MVRFAMQSMRSDSWQDLAGLGEQTISKFYIYFSASIAMSNVSLLTCGSIHQGSDSFGDVQRGRQCPFMNLSALLCGQVFSQQHSTYSQ